jgi:rsbT antagonist protein RsbS
VTVPLLKQGDMLIVPIQDVLSDKEFYQLQNEITEKIGNYQCYNVIVDVSVLDVIDSFATCTLRNIAQGTKLRGAQTIVVGIQPYVAFAMVQMGLTFQETALDFEEAIERIHTQSQRNKSHAR